MRQPIQLKHLAASDAGCDDDDDGDDGGDDDGGGGGDDGDGDDVEVNDGDDDEHLPTNPIKKTLADKRELGKIFSLKRIQKYPPLVSANT